MEISGNTSKNPNYERVKKVAGIGAGVGLGITALAYAATNVNYIGLKNADFAMKKARVETLQDAFSSAGVDMSKTTVSRSIKSAKRTILTSGLAKSVVLYSLFGAVIGSIANYFKNRNSKKGV